MSDYTTEQRARRRGARSDPGTLIIVVGDADMNRLVGQAGTLSGHVRAAKNPKRRSPTLREIESFLYVVRNAARYDQLQYTDSARADLAGLDMEEPAASMVIRNLEVEDFYKRVRSDRDSREDVWVFTPAVDHDESYWIRIVLRQNVIILSFHVA